MRKRIYLIFCATLLAALSACQTVAKQDGAAAAAPGGELRLAALFTDNLVLQQGQKNPVWGWAAPGAAIKVAVAGQEVKAKAGEDGKWKAMLHPLKAGGPHVMTVTSGAETKTFNNVLVGEVWIGSGQSNMQMPVKVGTYGVMNGEQEVAEANFPDIHLFTVPMKTSFEPLDDIASEGWKPCSPETVPGFSAALYFFGRTLHQDLNVPVGLIHSSWGGTIAEAWTSNASLRTLPDFGSKLDQLVASLPEIEKLRAEFDEKMKTWNDALSNADPGYQAQQPVWVDPAVDASAWPVMAIPNTWENAGLPGLDGSVWFRKDFDAPADWAGKELELRLGPINDQDRTWFNGQLVGQTDGASTPRVYAVPGNLVKAGANTIVVRAYDLGNVGGLFGAPDDLRVAPVGVAGAQPVALAGDWKYQVGLDLRKAPPKPELPLLRKDDPNVPTVLYNAMIAPVIPYGIRGAIWYQGESNASRAYQYRSLFPTLIRDWRQQWGQGDFPFLFVQLANFTARKPDPGEDAWAELREAQTMTLSEPNTGMAVIIDIGEADDIHPKNKQDVGRRLALPALANVYNRDIEYSGPMYKSHKVEGAVIRVTFDHAGSLAAKDGAPLKGFAIAGEDHKFVWADARVEGDTVVVSSPQVAAPVSVRYGWASNPEVNLYNSDGLPASPFRTDTWDGLTIAAK